MDIELDFDDDVFIEAETENSTNNESTNDKYIAIIGLDGRFGDSANLLEFWQSLESKKDFIIDVPLTRWTKDQCNIQQGGFIPDDVVFNFDYKFFGISQAEATSMDPQQRLLLEVSMGAFGHAGFTKDSLLNQQIGVYVGICGNDFAQTIKKTTIYGTTGASHSIAANRISYTFGLTGPSMAIDTACSSSLVAMHLASNALRNKECTAALVAGVNLLLTPQWTNVFDEMKMLADDYRCKTFSAEATGYVRGEGCGAVVVQLESTAINQGNPIWGIVCGTAVNQDGKTATLTAPSGNAQEKCIEAALVDASIVPDDVKYVECHGTGTPLGDPVEVEAIMNQYGKRTSPLILGALKSNLGHLEGAAGIAGLIKVVLSLYHRRVPPNLHHTHSFHECNATHKDLFYDRNECLAKPVQCSNTNPHVLEILEEHDVEVQFPSNSIELDNNNAIYAAVSSFGFGGTNSHIILKPAKVTHAGVPSPGFSKPSIEWNRQRCSTIPICTDLPSRERCGVKDITKEDSAWTVQFTKEPVLATVLNESNGSAEDYVVLTDFTLEYFKELIVNKKKIFYVSQHSFKVVHTDTIQNNHQISIGLMQGLFLEHRELFGGIVDLEQSVSSENIAEIIRRELHSTEYIVAYRNNIRYVARLVPTSVDYKTLDITDNRTYIITGGTGYLGQVIMTDLIKQGAKHIELWSRSSTCDLQAIPSDVTVKIKHPDIQNAASIESVMTDLIHPVDVVFHASGIVRECPIVDLTQDVVDLHINAKHPAAIMESIPTAHFIMFSSISALWGTHRYAMYGACNRLFECYAEDPRCQVLYYGPFAGGGMADGKEDNLKKTGLDPLDTSAVWKSFEMTQTKIIVASINIIKYSQIFSSRGRFSLFDGLVKGDSHPKAAHENSFLMSLFYSKDKKQAVSDLIDSLLNQQGVSMKHGESWMDSGFDSLSVVDFKSSLQEYFGPAITFTDTTLFDYPTPESLAKRVVEALFRSTSASSDVVYRNAQVEPIAVTGVACRFPRDANTPDAFWQSLCEKKNSIAKIPRERFDRTQYNIYVESAGCIENIDQFDNEFFGISPLEVESMDPQQRLLLQVSYEAFVQAHHDKESLKDSKIGVFVGIGTHDFATINKNSIGAYTATGQAYSIAANRISYTFGLKGPSIAIDTACSSALVALDAACKALYNNDCTEALVASVNLLLSPLTFEATCAAKMLSTDNRCATFSIDANGYARGEGCGAIVVKRTSDINDESTWAIIRATSINQDGHSANLTSPNGPSQEAVLKVALDRAGLEPNDIDYIEAHGTGTALGDPIEIQSISNVYGDRTKCLYIGAAKTNVGHLEPAAGMVGLIKTIMVLRHKQVPANLNLKEINPRIVDCIKKTNIQFPSETMLLQGQTIFAGVSSFGFGGTNGHVILESANDAIIPKSHHWHNKKFPIFTQNKINIVAERQSDPNEWIQEWTSELRDYIACHRVGSISLVPATCYMEIVMPCIRDLFGDQESFILKDLKFKDILYLDQIPIIKIQFIPDEMQFKLYSQKTNQQWQLHAEFRVELNIGPPKNDFNAEMIKKRCTDELDRDRFYAELGNDYQGDFKTVSHVWYNDKEALVEIDMTESTADGPLQSCGWVDAALHGSMVLIQHDGLAFFAKKAETYWVSSTSRPSFDNLMAHTVSDERYTRTTTFIYTNGSLVAVVKDSETGYATTFGSKTPIYDWSWNASDLTQSTNNFKTIILNIDESPYLSAVKDSLVENNKIILYSTQYRVDIVGLIRTINMEHPNNFVQFIIGTKEQVNQERNNRTDVVVQYDAGERTVLTMTPMSHKVLSVYPHQGYKLTERGVLTNLQRDVCLRKSNVGPTDVEVEIMSVGLNVRDVLNVLGLCPGDPGPPGGDMCGIVRRIGANVANVSINDTVLGFTSGSLQKYNTTNSELVVKAPPGLSVSELSSLPMATLTVEMAFYELYTITKDDIVLIHDGAGGVGLTAIEYATQVGATIIVTAGAGFEYEYLHSIGIANVLPSGDAAEFKKQTQHWKGKVTVVLNSLSENYINYSADLLCRGGSFMELGQQSLWTHDEMKRYRSDVEYNTIAVDHVLVQEPTRIHTMLERVSTRYNTYKPMPTTLFENAVEGLQYLQQGCHIGKVCWEPKSVELTGNIMITGGNGGLGNLFTEFIIKKYPLVHVFSLSRSAKPRSSNRLHYIGCDVSDKGQVEQTINNIPNLIGVIHCAGILRDGMFASLTQEDFDAVADVKVKSAQYIYEATKKHSLQFFLLCSSISAAMGSMGQANYAMANSALDDLAQQGQQEGRNIISVQWGAWDLGGGGMGSTEVLRRANNANHGVVTKQLGLQTLQTIVESASMETSLPPIIMVSPLGEWDGQKSNTSQEKWLSINARLERITAFLKSTFNSVTGKMINVIEPITDGGLDSLSAVEFRNAIRKEFGIITQSHIFQDGATIESIATEIETLLVPILLQQGSVDLKEAECVNKDPPDIRVIGFNCRFANASNLDEFWNVIKDKKPLIQENTFPRFSEALATYHSTLLENIDQFDYNHFNIKKNEASTLDPQHRLILESIKEALLDASIDTSGGMNERCHIYAAISHVEYPYLPATIPARTPVYYHALLGLLIKKAFNLHNSFYQQVDTACSSSIVALHRAVEDLKLNKCTFAIVTGVNLTLLPSSYESIESIDFLSINGVVQPFSKDGKGYVRGEGVGTIILTSVPEETNPVASHSAFTAPHHYCTILSTAMTQNTPSMDVIYTPDWDAQRDLHLHFNQECRQGRLSWKSTGPALPRVT